MWGGVVSISMPFVHPHISICPFIPPCTSVCPLCTPMSWGLWGILYILTCLGVFGGISASVRAFLCVSVHPFASQFITVIQVCSPSLWVASLLDWMPRDDCYASHCSCFLCSVFIMSQASATKPMTTTLQVTVVCSQCHLSSQWLPCPPPWLGFQQHQVSMMWFCHHCWHQGTLQVLALPLYGSSNLHLRCLFSFMPWVLHLMVSLSELSLPPFCVCICVVSVLVYAFCFQVTYWKLYSPMGAQPLGFAPLQPFEAYQ